MQTHLELFQPNEAPDLVPPKPRFRRSSKPERALWTVPPPTRLQRLYLPLRRLLDVVLGLALTVVALPIVVLAAVLVKLTSRGPAFYTQERVGKDGRLFRIYKLRTMIHNCESLTGPRWTIPGDPRITPIGWLLRRTHLDELPQLLNVLRGDMSLVGPRPERPEFVSELQKALPGYAQRHCVLPGITGLAQVQLPPDVDLYSVRRKLKYDLYFVTSLGLWLDGRILLATMLHMFGMSFAGLRAWGILPVVRMPEHPAAAALAASEPQPYRQAA